NAGHLVRGDRDAGSGPAAHDAGVELAPSDRLRHAERRLGPGLVLSGGRAELRDGVTAALELAANLRHEVSVVVRTQGDAHRLANLAGPGESSESGRSRSPRLTERRPGCTERLPRARKANDCEKAR